jgi:hypothetical protein
MDPGWRWEDLLARRPVLPDDQDAIRVTAAAAAKLPPGWPGDPPAGRVAPTSDEERRAAAQLYLLSLTETPSNQRLTTSTVDAIRRVLAAAVVAGEISARLADLPAGRAAEGERPVLVHLPTDATARTWSVANMLRLHAVLAAEDGRADDALAYGRAILGAARAAAEPPMLFTAVVAIANRRAAAAAVDRVLAQGEPSPAALAAIQQDVQDALDVPLLLEALRGERSLHEDLVRAIDHGRVTHEQTAEVSYFDMTPVTGLRPIDRWIHRLRGLAYSKRLATGIVRYQSSLIELFKESPDAPKRFPGAWAAMRGGIESTVRRSQRSLDQVINADRSQRALLASLVTALAAERFRYDASRWPSALDELVPAYLTNVPTDPYDLKPLRYRRLADGVVIYTLGPDEMDGGGEVRLEPGEGPWPDDVGIRLWDVTHRRQPPESGKEDG